MVRALGWKRVLAALAALAAAVACSDFAPTAAAPPPETATVSAAERAASPGFRSRRSLEQHYEKHGALFGRIGQDEYVDLARQLRDAPVGGPILEAVRGDGVVTRFDRATGRFGAYNPDGTIRTFFIPNDGESYFRRQARRPASR